MFLYSDFTYSKRNPLLLELVLLLEILDLVGWVGDDSILARLPSSWADFAILVNVLYYKVENYRLVGNMLERIYLNFQEELYWNMLVYELYFPYCYDPSELVLKVEI